MGIGTATRRVTDFVREMVPHMRYRLTKNEQDLGVHLRGNGALLEAVSGLVWDRIKGRERLPIPSDPIVCMATMARDKELRWLLSRLEYVYHSPVMTETAEPGEQPD